MNLPLSTFISIAFAFSAIVVGFTFWNKSSKELRILVIYLAFGFVAGIVMTILASQRINNLWLIHLQTPVRISLMMWMFSSWSHGAIQRLLLAVIPTFILFWGVMFLFFEDLTYFNTLTKPIEALMLIAVSGYILYRTNKESDEVFYRSSKFWVASGTLIYFSGMIFLYALFNQLLAISAEQLAMLWAPIQTIASVLSYIMYIMGFLCLSPLLRPQQ